ncbi:hypothetical protein [Paenibacillus sp. FSL H3-0286]|uniref:hypothetical protein n=1 Tax=Paenibacillus sp. FSL H3-0286 TaxID=2921427 RepID=UPI003243AD84
MNYLEYIMNGLGNILHNTSQNPSEKACNQVLDSIKRMLEEYNEAGGKVNITDYRDGNPFNY